MKISYVSYSGLLAVVASLVSRNVVLAVKYTHKVTIEVDKEGQHLGEIVLGLRGDVVPKTVENFIAFCKGTEIKGVQRSYVGTPFHRVIHGFMIQGGDVVEGNGSGSTCIYGDNKSFDDESFKLRHGPGVIAMANRGPNTNGSQFYITTVATSWLDGKHVVFGEVIGNKETLQAIELTGSSSGTPTAKTTIKSCTVKKI
ncbi:bifunctional Cyclophilin-type peptidyl-prolyl cis-trans isomerase [Babesia duncani]|uniref:Peptidyl-prolyl cis-trans isomerase n=1 Tax=Babesia duncani TaxID=323732 RepID=A0AAD9PHK6_9APIC|nr:bifunctional Cyclophilin-type peptidyl-prolyl cis-trans isomerase [Babesia duncani]KAK2195282.1 bifunctional Cyclophilin-type peptidyl-prolyl cis-trans isomerase [Babesia duncani]